MSAIVAGATDGLKLAGGIAASLIAMLGLVALIDAALNSRVPGCPYHSR